MPTLDRVLVIDLTVEGNPIGKERPRLGKGGHVYTPNKTLSQETAIKWAIRDELRDYDVDGESEFALLCYFYRNDLRRVDADNCLKLVSDAANGMVWKDDSQVVEVYARLYRGCARAYSQITIYKFVPELDR